MVIRGRNIEIKYFLRILILVALTPVACGARPVSNLGVGSSQAGFTADDGRADKSTVLNVFAAASLTEAFGVIGQDFEQSHPGVKVLFNFAGSQQLAQQLVQGAPADVFASANQKQMQVVIEEGDVSPGSTQIIAQNRLVVIVPADNPGHINSPVDLANSGLRLVLAASEVPAGQYALEFLDKASQDNAYGTAYKNQMLVNVVSYEDNVKAVLNKVVLGEADGGIVYTSDANAESTGSIKQIQIPEPLNVEASYPIAVVAASPQAGLAKAFIESVLSSNGQEILAKFGFNPVKR